MLSNLKRNQEESSPLLQTQAAPMTPGFNRDVGYNFGQKPEGQSFEKQ